MAKKKSPKQIISKNNDIPNTTQNNISYNDASTSNDAPNFTLIGGVYIINAKTYDMVFTCNGSPIIPASNPVPGP